MCWVVSLSSSTFPWNLLPWFRCRWSGRRESKCLTRGQLFACSWESAQKNTAGKAFSLIANVTLHTRIVLKAMKYVHPASVVVAAAQHPIRTAYMNLFQTRWCQQGFSTLCVSFIRIRPLHQMLPWRFSSVCFSFPNLFLFPDSLMGGTCMPNLGQSGSCCSRPALGHTLHWL